jgi:hypothetical protein
MCAVVLEEDHQVTAFLTRNAKSGVSLAVYE